MGPLSLFKVWRIYAQWKDKIKEQQKLMPGKALFTSKTFWANTLLGALALMKVVPVNEYTLGGEIVLNVFLRLLTNQPITGLVSAK